MPHAACSREGQPGPGGQPGGRRPGQRAPDGGAGPAPRGGGGAPQAAGHAALTAGGEGDAHQHPGRHAACTEEPGTSMVDPAPLQTTAAIQWLDCSSSKHGVTIPVSTLLPIRDTAPMGT